MTRLLFFVLVFVLTFGACKTTDSPVETSATSAAVVTTPEKEVASASQTSAAAPATDQESAYRFQAFVQQGDAAYEKGEYRSALNFYKQARAIAPEQIDKAKMVACIKAMQEPSVRNKK